jgi:phage terminase large subunit
MDRRAFLAWLAAPLLPKFGMGKVNSMNKLKVDVDIPEKLKFLFTPSQYKVAYSGRDGCKSWSFAQALLAMATQKPLRILCTRETQKSLRESVHQLLSDTIKRLKLENFFQILQSEIRGRNGSVFIFGGLREASVAEIKSYEAVDIAWVEEAQCVSKKSWQTLIPTIRKPGSEIWVSLNPELEDDDTYQRWIVDPPPNTVVVKTNYRDNRWLSQESKQNIEYLRNRDPETFAHVYEGHTRSTVKGAIYREQLLRAESEGRICRVAYDARLSVSTFWDLGWSDLVCIWFAQCIGGFQYRLIDYYESHYQDTDHYLQVLQARGYTYQEHVWPWDAASKMMQNTMQQTMANKGFRVRILPRASVMDGIDAVRLLFANLWFDSKNCDEGLIHLRRYQWGELKEGDRLRREPLHDIHSHAADALRTLAMSLREPEQEKPAYRSAPRPLSNHGWMR